MYVRTYIEIEVRSLLSLDFLAFVYHHIKRKLSDDNDMPYAL